MVLTNHYQQFWSPTSDVGDQNCLVATQAPLDLRQRANALETDHDQKLLCREGADPGVTVLGGDIPTAPLITHPVALVTERGVDDIVGDLDRHIEGTKGDGSFGSEPSPRRRVPVSRSPFGPGAQLPLARA